MTPRAWLRKALSLVYARQDVYERDVAENRETLQRIEAAVVELSRDVNRAIERSGNESAARAGIGKDVMEHKYRLGQHESRIAALEKAAE